MKKVFNDPEMTVTSFEYEDIICASTVVDKDQEGIPEEDEELELE